MHFIFTFPTYWPVVQKNSVANIFSFLFEFCFNFLDFVSRIPPIPIFLSPVHIFMFRSKKKTFFYSSISCISFKKTTRYFLIYYDSEVKKELKNSDYLLSLIWFFYLLIFFCSLFFVYIFFIHLINLKFCSNT